MWKILIEKVIPPLLVSCCLGTAGGVMMIWNKLDKIETIDVRVTSLERDITVLKSQMVTWDLVKRIELGVNTYAQIGKGNEVMGVVGKVLKMELDARKENK
jgi:hypothetical protein